MYAEASANALRSCTSLAAGAAFDLSSVAAGGAPPPPPPMPICTGDAAPRLVPGAIAATWQA